MVIQHGAVTSIANVPIISPSYDKCQPWASSNITNSITNSI